MGIAAHAVDDEGDIIKTGTAASGEDILCSSDVVNHHWLAQLPSQLQMTEKNLRLYNDVYDGSEPIEDEVIYLEMKSTKSPESYHILQEGDTYRYIAQRYGIQLKILIKRNSGNINNYKVGDKICIGCN